MWRDQQARTDSRVTGVEEIAERVAGELEKLHNSVALLDGRQTGLGERVQNVRRDVSEVVDNVREEFAKFNQLLEKQRRKQIQILEQELREMKFHAFRPPEEP
jgi:DNA anti-recombination protein RmuC